MVILERLPMRSVLWLAPAAGCFVWQKEKRESVAKVRGDVVSAGRWLWQERGAAGEAIRLARMGTFSCARGNAVEGTPVPCKLLGSFLPRSPFIVISSRLVSRSPELQLQERRGVFPLRSFVQVVLVAEERPDGTRSCRLRLRSRSHPDCCGCCGTVPLTHPCQTLPVLAAGEELGRGVRE